MNFLMPILKSSYENNITIYRKLPEKASIKKSSFKCEAGFLRYRNVFHRSLSFNLVLIYLVYNKIWINLKLELKSMQQIIGLLNSYGNIVLPISLMLELIALPLPGETMLTYCGFLVNQGKMSLVLSILVAAIGAIIGVTLSYFIGRILGTPFFEKYGHYVHMDKKNLDKVSVWFEKYGNKLLIVSYFIPGVRHVTGYFSGITGISYKKFALYSYIGAIIWTSTFISLGTFFGSNWNKYHGVITAFLLKGGLVIFLIAIVIYILSKYKFYLNEVSKVIFSKISNKYNSIVKESNAVIGVAVSILILSVVIIGFVE